MSIPCRDVCLTSRSMLHSSASSPGALQAPAQHSLLSRHRRGSTFSHRHCSEGSSSSASHPQLGHVAAAHISPLEHPPRTRSTITMWGITGIHVGLPSSPFPGLVFAGRWCWAADGCLTALSWCANSKSKEKRFMLFFSFLSSPPSTPLKKVKLGLAGYAELTTAVKHSCVVWQHLFKRSIS